MTTKVQKKTKKPTGRPARYSDPNEFIQKAKEYFAMCDAKDTLPEKAGFCVFMGFHKDTYNVYKRKRGFTDALKDVEARIQSAWVARLGNKAQAAGAIFYLKNAP